MKLSDFTREQVPYRLRASPAFRQAMADSGDLKEEDRAAYGELLGTYKSPDGSELCFRTLGAILVGPDSRLSAPYGELRFIMPEDAK